MSDQIIDPVKPDDQVVPVVDPNADPALDDVPTLPFWSGVNASDIIEVEGQENETIEPEVPEGPYAGLTNEELSTKLKILEDQLEASKGQADTAAAIQQGIAQLGEKINQPVQAPVPQQPQETDEDFAKRLNEQVYDKGFYESMMEFNQRKLGPVIGQQAQSLLFFARRDLEHDPARAETYKQFKTDIDALVSKNPGAVISDPELYIKAHDQIVAGHQPELIDAKVEKIVEEKLKALGVAAAQSTPAVPFSESGVTPPIRKPTKAKIKKLTQAEEAFRARIGVPRGDFFAWLERHPAERAKLKEGNQ